MINEPAVDKLVEKLGTKEHPASRYELCVVVAKRARQVIDQAQNQGIKELPLVCSVFDRRGILFIYGAK